MWRTRTTRRDFLRTVGAGALAAGVPILGRGPSRAAAQGGRRLRLRILQWQHFVPPYDDWFNNVFAPRWGERHNVEVVVDNVGLADLPAIAAAEAARVAAGQDPGHDMIQHLSPPAALEPQVIDHGDLIKELLASSHPARPGGVGNYTKLAHLSTYNPVTGKYFGFSDNFVPDPIHYRADLWRQAAAQLDGFDGVHALNGPVTWHDILRAGRVLKRMGHPVGFGLSQELDSNMILRAMMYSWGTAIQDQDSNVVLDKPPFREKTLDLLRFVKQLYEEAMFPGVFAWTAASNNEEFLAGRLSMAANAISISRTAQAAALQALERGENPETSPAIQFAVNTEITSLAPAGPEAARGLEHVMGVYAIWDTGNTAVIDAAQQLLFDLVHSFDPDVAEAEGWGPGKFVASQAYDYPTFDNAIPAQKRLAFLRNDPIYAPIAEATGDRPNKLERVEAAMDWALHVGWPGPANAAIDEVFNTFVIPVMFARVAQGIDRPEDALDEAARQIRSIFNKWRREGLVGGTS
ncbi:MAG: twin-arginine translocation signal domain-containing protein [Firmicutes bacterium]|nr:twin-arginine translocation signal domain-containing protein [Bacillota bacterium]